jgi:hypothetical protein
MSFLGDSIQYVSYVNLPAVVRERIERHLFAVRRPLGSAAQVVGLETWTKLLPSTLLIQTPTTPDRTDAKTMRFPCGENAAFSWLCVDGTSSTAGEFGLSRSRRQMLRLFVTET